MNLSQYIENCYSEFPELENHTFPWDMVHHLETLLKNRISKLSASDYDIKDQIAIHKSALIENGVTIKGALIIGENSIIKAGAYLRDGVFLGRNAMIGANCEVKQSVIFNESRIAHLNYVGNSLIGHDVNMEAGSILANHFNEIKNRTIQLVVSGKVVDTKVMKFGSVLADGVRIGANAVLNPGTVLEKGRIVGRLVHVDQLKDPT